VGAGAVGGELVLWSEDGGGGFWWHLFLNVVIDTVKRKNEEGKCRC
jgi:hypothetical protein